MVKTHILCIATPKIVTMKRFLNTSLLLVYEFQMLELGHMSTFS